MDVNIAGDGCCDRGTPDTENRDLFVGWAEEQIDEEVVSRVSSIVLSGLEIFRGAMLMVFR